MGFDLYQCTDWLEQRGLSELQLGNMIDNIQNPQFVNVLKPAFRPPQMVMAPGQM